MACFSEDKQFQGPKSQWMHTKVVRFLLTCFNLVKKRSCLTCLHSIPLSLCPLNRSSLYFGALIHKITSTHQCTRQRPRGRLRSCQCPPGFPARRRSELCRWREGTRCHLEGSLSLGAAKQQRLAPGRTSVSSQLCRQALTLTSRGLLTQTPYAPLPSIC